MAETKTCPHCGETIWAVPDHHYCMHCGGDLVNTTDPIAIRHEDGTITLYNYEGHARVRAIMRPDGEKVFLDDTPPYRPHWVQTLAGVLLILCTAVGIGLTPLMPPEGQALTSTLDSLLYVLAMTLLISRAKNNAVQWGALGLAVCATVSIAIDALSYSGAISHVVMDVKMALWGFAVVYCLSLIIRNSHLPLQQQAWPNLLAVLASLAIFWALFPLWSSSFFRQVSQGFAQYGDFFRFSILFILWLIVYGILHAAGYWVLARSEAFSGDYDAKAPVNYSPLNKWMATAVIMPVVMSLLMYFFYDNLFGLINR